jgi:acetyl-CoA carboxylase biotin carboxyl carrier protein
VSDQSGKSTTSAQSDHEQLAGLVQSFIGMMQAGNMSELEVEYRDLKLSLRAGSNGRTPYAVVPADVSPQALPQPAVTSAIDDDSHIIAAPMIGTFYAAPAPNEPVFVQVGDHVDEGQTIGIIEAMKIMNEIASDQSGVVVEMIARNAETVEYGSPLIRIRPDAG